MSHTQCECRLQGHKKACPTATIERRTSECIGLSRLDTPPQHAESVPSEHTEIARAQSLPDGNHREANPGMHWPISS
eukprot:350742-Chlamydomonas_euryale.AAC.7